MAGYLDTLRKDIARWHAEGLIDERTAAALVSDVEKRPGRISFGSILAMLAAVLLGAALLLLIAANWDALPRLSRVFLIFSGMAAGYVGGAWLKLRRHEAFGEALWVLAATAFGAGIALIAQMYHLSGDEAQAVLVWCVGTAFAAAALRSHPLTVGAVLLAVAWLLMLSVESETGVPLSYLLVAAGLWAVSLWTRSMPARHLVLLSLMLLAILFYMEGIGLFMPASHDARLAAPLALAVVSVTAFGLAVTLPDRAESVLRLGGGLSVQGLIGFVAGMSVVQFEVYGEWTFTLAAVLVLAGVVGALILAGRESRMLRWLAYAGFIWELGLIYLVLLGSMLGTAGFFFVAGVVLAAVAWAISRIERRIAFGRPGGARAA